MDFLSLLSIVIILCVVFLLLRQEKATASSMQNTENNVKEEQAVHVKLVRHATLLVEVGGTTLLVDPMLNPAGTKPPIQNSTNDRRNPLIDLPVGAETITKVDAVILTHTHSDHFDEAAESLLDKDLLLFCQPSDEEKLKKKGFINVHTIEKSFTWKGIKISRSLGQHGSGELGQRMGNVSGYVLQAVGQPTLYIAGDTVWCQEVEAALETYQPQIVILFAGAAQFNDGKPITMTAEDVTCVCRKVPNASVVAVHMEALNHCLLTRDMLKKYLVEQGLQNQVHVPKDGEKMAF